MFVHLYKSQSRAKKMGREIHRARELEEDECQPETYYTLLVLSHYQPWTTTTTTTTTTIQTIP
jgi:hypothetical protein